MPSIYELKIRAELGDAEAKKLVEEREKILSPDYELKVKAESGDEQAQLDYAY